MPTWIMLSKTLGKKSVAFLKGVQPFLGWTFPYMGIYDFDNVAECVYLVHSGWINGVIRLNFFKKSLLNVFLMSLFWCCWPGLNHSPCREGYLVEVSCWDGNNLWQWAQKAKAFLLPICRQEFWSSGKLIKAEQRSQML